VGPDQYAWSTIFISKYIALIGVSPIAPRRQPRP
jgi:hypothetical protein